MDQSRVKVIERIKEYERLGLFDKDVEDDVLGRTIMPGEVDYLKKKLSSKIKTRYAYFIARRFLNKIIKEKKMIIKDIKGIENFNSLKGGAIITCNHFNALDSFAIQVAYEASNCFKKKKFYRIIKEGNYTSFPGFYGTLMRNCYTLPLSSNREALKEFKNAVDTVLKNGDLVVIYPEQSMWWNYRKPKPLKKTAYSFACKNDVCVLPCFITMEDSDILGEDGFYIQEYTINIGKPIYQNPNLSLNENVFNMMKENEDFWRDTYEGFYNKKLEYDTIK